MPQLASDIRSLGAIARFAYIVEACRIGGRILLQEVPSNSSISEGDRRDTCRERTRMQYEDEKNLHPDHSVLRLIRMGDKIIFLSYGRRGLSTRYYVRCCLHSRLEHLLNSKRFLYYVWYRPR
jgi:hypothetical protein